MIVFYEDLLKIEFMDESEFCEKFGIEGDYWEWVSEDGSVSPDIYDFNIDIDAVNHIKDLAEAHEITYKQAYELFDVLCAEIPELEYYCYS